MIMDNSYRFNNRSKSQTKQIQHHYELIQHIFIEMEHVLVAFSGGVDSALLLKVGTDALGAKCTGVLGVSPSLAGDEKNQAIQFAQKLNANLEILFTREMENPLYLQNDHRRCFYCKQELYSEIWRLAEEKNIHFVVDGTNADDVTDYRPGLDAAKALKVRSPLLEAGLGKDDIRNLAQYLNIPVWDKPAQPCLASRVMYGQPIEAAVLEKIYYAEQFIKKRGYKIVRVRSIGSYASVEVGKDEVDRLLQEEESHVIIKTLYDLGFQKVHIDPDGYRQGKLNARTATG